jgi:hypothetical protein
MTLATLHFVSEAAQAGESVVITSWVELLTCTVIITGLSAFWHKHNCHEHGCLRLSWHPDADGHPVCKVHHPDHPAKSWFRSDKEHPRHKRNKNQPGQTPPISSSNS